MVDRIRVQALPIYRRLNMDFLIMDIMGQTTARREINTNKLVSKNVYVKRIFMGMYQCYKFFKYLEFEHCVYCEHCLVISLMPASI